MIRSIVLSVIFLFTFSGYGYDIDPLEVDSCNQEGPTINSLHRAVEYGDEEKIKFYLPITDINARDSLERTPLHCLSFYQFKEHYDKDLITFKTMLAYNADVGLQDKYGCTVFHDIAARGMTRLADDCLEKPKILLKTLLIISKRIGAILKKKIPKSLILHIANLANPCCKIVSDPKLQDILSLKDETGCTAYDIAFSLVRNKKTLPAYDIVCRTFFFKSEGKLAAYDLEFKYKKRETMQEIEKDRWNKLALLLKPKENASIESESKL